MPEVYLSEASKNEPLVLMQISCGNGDMCSLFIGEYDDSAQLARLFVQTLGLGESYIPRVELQINDRRKQAIDSREIAVNEDRASEASSIAISPAEAAYHAARENWHNSPPSRSGIDSGTSQIPTSYRDLKYTSADRDNVKRLPNQEVFDRMHNYSKHKAQRAVQLRNRMENERVKQIESSTFK